MTDQATSRQLLPLDSERRIFVRDRAGHSYGYFFERISPEQWDRLGDEFVHTREYGEGEKIIHHFDADQAVIDFVRSNVKQTVGYAGMAAAPLDWRARLPLGHVELVAEALLRVMPNGVSSAGCGFWCSLVADWNVGDQLVTFKNLVHVFDAPGIKHERLFLNSREDTTVKEGSKIRLLSRHRLLQQIYDDLIVSVSGYSVGGARLGDDRVAIIREMTHPHKWSAVCSLMSMVTRRKDGC